MGRSLPIVIATLLALTVIPFPSASSTVAGPNFDVMTPRLVDALEGGAPSLRVIVSMDREFTEDDVAFLEARGALYHTRLASLPVAVLTLTPSALTDLSWVSGVTHLDLDRELRLSMVTANQATQAAAVWGEAGDGGIIAANPVEDASGNVIDGSGVTVAIIDSGIDGTHPDLPYGTKVTRNYKHVCATPGLSAASNNRCYGNNLVGALVFDTTSTPRPAEVFVEMPNTDSTSGHGTHVAGSVGGTGAASNGLIKGAAPGADLVGYGGGEVIFVSGIIEAMDHINVNWNNPAVFPNPIRVVSNSYGDCMVTGTPSSEAPVYNLLSQLTAKGILFVYAAGNNDDTCDGANDGTIDETSSYCDLSYYLPGVICVANGDDKNSALRQTMKLNPGSKFGARANPATWPDLTAPGTRITSTWGLTGALGPTGFTDRTPYYTTFTGTSMATPQVSAIVALVLDANPALTAGQVEDILEDSAIELSDGTGAGVHVADATNPGTFTSFNQGHGLVNALGAVNAAIATSQPGSALGGVGGDLHLYQQAQANPFIGQSDQMTSVRGTTNTLSIRSGGFAPWALASVATSDVTFVFRDAASGAVVETVVGQTTGTETDGSKRWNAADPMDLAVGDYVYEGRIAGRLVDSNKLRVVGDFPPPTCAASDVALAISGDGFSLRGVISGDAPVDKVRVDAILGAVPGGWGTQVRETAAGITDFEVELSLATLDDVTGFQITTLMGTVPCILNVGVPSVTPEGLQTTQPYGLFQPNNAYVNPGFEVTSVAEGDSSFAPGAPHGRTVAPPTIMYLDDGSGDTPASTHDVAVGGGENGNALRINWDADDYSRNLLVGQLFGVDGAPYTHQGATTVAFSVKSNVAIDDIHVGLWHGSPSVRAGSQVYDIPASTQWTRYELPISVPADSDLHALLFHVRAATDGQILIDNVVIEGSTFVAKSMRNDLTDGYSPILLPASPVSNVGFDVLEPKATGLGDHYLMQVEVRDYTAIDPRVMESSEITSIVGSIYGTQYLADGASRDNLELFSSTIRSNTDSTRMLLAVPKDVALEQSDAGLAAAWVWADVAGVGEFTGTLGEHSSPTGGYYSVPRNQLAGYTVADSMDLAFTPIQLTEDPDSDVSAPASVAIVTPTGGSGFSVRIQPPVTPWIETATLKVTGFSDQAIVLDGSGDEILVSFPGSADGRSAELTSTLFVRGDRFVAGLPVPVITVDPAAPQLSLTTVTFSGAASTDPVGAGLDYTWEFGDGSGAVGEEVTHIFAGPGTYQVSLTVTDGDGNSDTAFANVQVLNRAPSARAIAPLTATRMDAVRIGGAGSDMDGSIATVSVSLDGVPQGTGTGSIFEVLVPAGTLSLGTHTVDSTVTDDAGATATASKTFTVVNVAPAAALATPSAVVGSGQPLTFAVVATDPDGASVTATLDFGDGSPLVTNPAASEAHTYTGASARYVATLTVTDADGAIAVATKTIDVDGNDPTTTMTFDGAATPDLWSNEDVTVAVSVADDFAGAKAYSKLDAGAFTLYTTPFDVTGEGMHTVAAYGVDAVGNVGPTVTKSFGIDKTQPTADASGLPNDFSVVGGVVTLAGSGTDGLSGMKSVTITIDGEAVATGVSSVTYEWDTTGELVGVHDIEVVTEDVAGNVNSTIVTVIVLNAPAA